MAYGRHYNIFKIKMYKPAILLYSEIVKEKKHVSKFIENLKSLVISLLFLYRKKNFFLENFFLKEKRLYYNINQGKSNKKLNLIKLGYNNKLN